jgi:hypothetical protein
VPEELGCASHCLDSVSAETDCRLEPGMEGRRSRSAMSGAHTAISKLCVHISFKLSLCIRLLWYSVCVKKIVKCE